MASGSYAGRRLIGCLADAHSAAAVSDWPADSDADSGVAAAESKSNQPVDHWLGEKASQTGTTRLRSS